MLKPFVATVEFTRSLAVDIMAHYGPALGRAFRSDIAWLSGESDARRRNSGATASKSAK